MITMNIPMKQKQIHTDNTLVIAIVEEKWAGLESLD